MHKSLLEWLVDPVSKLPLQLVAAREQENGQVVEGTLHSEAGRAYPITNGIPRFVLTADPDQRQTERSFGFKWQQEHTYSSPQVRLHVQTWFVERYGFQTVEALRKFFDSRRRMLDAGCGGGSISALWLESASREGQGRVWCGVDISAAIDVARARCQAHEGVHFIQGDILQLPFPAGTFDAILAEGVLHHTPSTQRALEALAAVLQPGGELLFYVYRKKGPVREFTDDHIRSLVSSLEPEAAWEVLRPLTKLGKALAELRVDVEVPEDIPSLGITAGRYDVQRLLYWHFAKLFWNTAYSFEENHHVNFDWYHPRYAHRHTEEEVRQWCEAAGLSIRHFHAQDSGFTIRAVRV